jgi:hypothetical protein
VARIDGGLFDHQTSRLECDRIIEASLQSLPDT